MQLQFYANTKRIIRWLIAFAVTCSVLCEARVAAAPSIDHEKLKRVQAGYLLNFPKFTSWPKQAFAREDSPLVIGVVDDSRLANLLKQVASKQAASKRRVRKRQVSVIDIRPQGRGVASYVDQMAQCHVLFIGQPQLQRTAQIADLLKNKPVLLIGQSGQFAKAGGVIGLVIADGRIVFEINTDQVKRRQLRISSKLLSMARVVTNKKAGKGTD